MKKLTFLLVIHILLFFTLSHLHAVSKNFTTKDIESLSKEHVEHVYLSVENDEQKISISEPKLAPRIHINECDTDLAVNILENHNSRNINVKISCQLPSAWQIYLPFKINKRLPVLVAVSNLNKGTTLDKDNTRINFVNVHKIRGETLSNNKSIIGAKLKRNIQKDSAIYIKSVCVICKGESVTILASSDTFQIKTNGTALSNGTIGDQIRIKNTRSGKIITARVKSLNKVVINL